MNLTRLIVAVVFCVAAVQAGTANVKEANKFVQSLGNMTPSQRQAALQQVQAEIAKDKARLDRVNPVRRKALRNIIATNELKLALYKQQYAAPVKAMAARNDDDDVSFLDNVEATIANATQETKQELLVRAESLLNRLTTRLESEELSDEDKRIVEQNIAIVEKAIVLLKTTAQSTAEPLAPKC